jgi:predicted SAM-dependent methyltransferase
MDREPDALKPYLNLGCGHRFHPEWINIDMVAHDSHVIQHDLSRGIPLPDASCEVVYHAAVLEHIRRVDAPAFLRECWRVLKPGGIIRIGVPDLEHLCHLYLEKLALAVDGDQEAAHDYDWILLELYDQTVREQSGGEMLGYLRQEPLPNEGFVYARIGEEGRNLVQMLRRPASRHPQLSSPRRAPFLHRVRRRISALPAVIRNRLLAYLLGQEGLRALAIGRFRLSGEVHQWMYDRYSLTKLLLNTGFDKPILCNAMTSAIPNWLTYNLDTMPESIVLKPDLFFVEATKPEV